MEIPSCLSMSIIYFEFSTEIICKLLIIIKKILKKNDLLKLLKLDSKFLTMY